MKLLPMLAVADAWDRVIGGVCVRVCVCVCVCVSAGKRKRLKLSTPNLVHMCSMADARHALTGRSKGQRSRSHGYENRHGRVAAVAVVLLLSGTAEVSG